MFRYHTTTNQLTPLLALGLLGLTLTACDPGTAGTSTGGGGGVISNNNTPTNNGTVNNNPNPTTPVDPISTIPNPEDPGHSEDDDSVIIPIGEAQGSWRAAVDDVNDTMAVTFELVHDKGSQDVTGTWKMGDGINPGLMGARGDLISGTYNSGLTLKFNPTNDETDEWTLQTTMKVSDSEYKAQLTNIDSSITESIVLQLQDF